MERRKNKGLGRGSRGRESRLPLPPRQRAPLSSLCPPASADSAGDESLQSGEFPQGRAVKDLLPATLSVAETHSLVEVPHSPLARICEEDEDGTERISDDLQLMYAEDWSSLLGNVGVTGSSSPDFCTKKAEAKLEESRAAKRSRSDAETHQIKDTCFSSSSCVWQKLDHLEQSFGSVAKMLLSSMELLHVHVEKEFSDLRSEQERARKEFTTSFAAMFQSHKQNIEREMVQLRANLGFIAASGSGTPPTCSRMPPRPHIHENISARINSNIPADLMKPHSRINSNVPADLMEQHISSCEEMFQKLQAVGASTEDLDPLQKETSPDSMERCKTSVHARSSVQLAEKFEDLGAPCDLSQKLTMKEEHTESNQCREFSLADGDGFESF